MLAGKKQERERKKEKTHEMEVLNLDRNIYEGRLERFSICCNLSVQTDSGRFCWDADFPQIR